MAAADPLAIPRAGYGLFMAAVTLAGLACAWIASNASSGGEAASGSALLALSIASIASFVPAILSIGRDYWGVAVLFSGTARALLAVAICYLMVENQPGLPSRPLITGVIAGAVLILVAESAAAVVILSRLERKRQELKNSGRTAA